MGPVVKIHRSERATAISTNAATEQEFLSGFAAQQNGPCDVVLLTQLVDVCCKLRGYKANVIEHRVIVAGEWLPDDVVEVFTPRERVRESVKG